MNAGWRLAFRHEGMWWVAYVAPEETMEGKMEIGRIVLSVVVDEKTRKGFMELMKGAIDGILRAKVGEGVTGWSEDMAAPEHEKAGHS